MDLSKLLPGSLCGQMLADMGAEVIKLEDLQGGDAFRYSYPTYENIGSYFHILNRNKRSLRLNLSAPKGREIMLRLVDKADVLLETFRPGLMDKLGLGCEELSRRNPRLVYCSLTGFGQDGPYRNLPSHDINLLSLSGILDLIGERNGPPVTPGLQIAGVGGGALNCCIGILAALYQRVQTGRGTYLDVSILDGTTPFLSLCMAEYMATGTAPSRGGNQVGGGTAFYNVYETADSKYLALGCLEPKFWGGFCRAIGREDLIDQQFNPPENQQEIIQEVQKIIKKKTRAEWLEQLEVKDICISPVNSLEEAYRDPHIRQRGLWFKTEHPMDGKVGQQGFPIKFGPVRPGLTRPAPGYGEHTEEILLELGLSKEDLESLVEAGVI
ncbi:MAG: CoA transferase [Firmicutes bacterium]|nr:CoA transferase [Bacillota bacterium]